jgi:hypothetical protein
MVDFRRLDVRASRSTRELTGVFLCAIVNTSVANDIMSGAPTTECHKGDPS